MAGIISSFLQSGNLVIRIGDHQVAYAQGLNFNDRMTTVAVGGIGAFSAHTLEPVGYSASGSIRIMRYSNSVANSIGNAAMPSNTKALHNTPIAAGPQDGNGLFDYQQLNPRQLLISQTFDIEVYDKTSQSNIENTPNIRLTYVLKDCRIDRYSFNLTNGRLLEEVIDFTCLAVQDESVVAVSATETLKTINTR